MVMKMMHRSSFNHNEVMGKETNEEKVTETRKRDSKIANVPNFAKVLTFLPANKRILNDFKEKFNEWSQKFSEEWRTFQDVKFKAMQSANLSPLVKILSTAIPTLCVLECCKTSDVSYLLLGLGFYQTIKLVKTVSDFVISYICSLSDHESMVHQHFDELSTMVQLFVHHLTVYQERSKCSLTPDLRLNTPRDVCKKKVRPVFSSYDILLGFFLALATSSLRSHYGHQHLSNLETALVHLLTFVFLAKDTKLPSIIKEVRRNREIMKDSTKEFTFWFKNECELKKVIEESGLRNETLIETSQSLDSLKHLDQAVSIVACEKISELNLPRNVLEEAVSFLTYDEKYSTLKTKYFDEKHLNLELKTLMNNKKYRQELPLEVEFKMTVKNQIKDEIESLKETKKQNLMTVEKGYLFSNNAIHRELDDTSFFQKDNESNFNNLQLERVQSPSSFNLSQESMDGKDRLKVAKEKLKKAMEENNRIKEEREVNKRLKEAREELEKSLEGKDRMKEAKDKLKKTMEENNKIKEEKEVNNRLKEGKEALKKSIKEGKDRMKEAEEKLKKKMEENNRIKEARDVNKRLEEARETLKKKTEEKKRMEEAMDKLKKTMEENNKIKEVNNRLKEGKDALKKSIKEGKDRMKEAGEKLTKTMEENNRIKEARDVNKRLEEAREALKKKMEERKRVEEKRRMEEKERMKKKELEAQKIKRAEDEKRRQKYRVCEVAMYA